MPPLPDLSRRRPPAPALRRLADAAALQLPSGRTLPPDVWRRRHRGMLGVIWLHLAALAGVALVERDGPLALAYGLGPIVVCALAASLPTGSRRLRGSMASLAALYCSAEVVHLAHGATEAHFHFFVMVAMLAAYEEWVPYLIAIAFVIVHHAVLGVVAPQDVYGRADVGRPVLWASVHAGFILALSVVNVVSWRLNEEARAATAAALERTRRSEAEFRGAFEDAPIGVAVASLAGRFGRVNRALAAMTGHAPEELLALSIHDVAPEPAAALGAPEATAGSASAEGPYLRADGSSGWAVLQRSVVRDARGAATHVVLELLDLSARKEAEDRLGHLALHDPLTGLANRELLERRAAALAARLVPGAELAVLVVDLDDFKVVNDSLGHHAGDRLLLLVAERLRRALGGEGVLARVGGDEFAILLEATDEVGAGEAAERVRAYLRAPFDVDGQRRFVTASIGITLSGRSGAEPVALLRDGDVAMNSAKAAGKDRHVVFDDDLRAAAVGRLELEEGLRRALEEGQLELHYQPEFDLADGRPVAVEALVRWRHPTRGMIAPGEFVPIAEHSGLIVPIGRFVLEEACRQAADWRARGIGPADLVTAVNLSAVQLADAQLLGDVATALHRHALPVGALCLEVTESAMVHDPEGASRTLRALERLGVRIAIDDFGTGYSSLGHLKHLLPVDVLKLDRSFVQGMATSAADAAIVQAVIEMAHRLGIVVVAEGIEEEAQASALRQLRCDVGQGYWLGRPAPAAQVEVALVAADADLGQARAA